MNARTGKIARLPGPIREQLNQRLHDGVKTSEILEWLNPLPEVQAVLLAHFEGQPISHMNISHWRSGGYLEWLSHQETLKLFTSLQEQDFASVAAPPNNQSPPMAVILTNKLILWTVSQLAAMACSIPSIPVPEERWNRLRELAADLSRFRRSDLYAEYIRLQADWLALDQSNSAAAKEKQFLAWLEKREQEKKASKTGALVTPELWEQVERELNLL